MNITFPSTRLGDKLYSLDGKEVYQMRYLKPANDLSDINDLHPLELKWFLEDYDKMKKKLHEIEILAGTQA